MDNNALLELKNRLAALPVLKERLQKLDARIVKSGRQRKGGMT